MSDITLTAGVRQNLLSLQNTSADLTTTQERLSTGKKVNTAFDNPTSYFTSQALTNRANDLSALLDQIGQAQQTLDEANNGLTSLTSLLEQALSTAQQAQQSALGTVNYTQITGTTAISPDTTKVTSTATVASAVASSGVTASVQSHVILNSTGYRRPDRRRHAHLYLRRHKPHRNGWHHQFGHHVRYPGRPDRATQQHLFRGDRDLRRQRWRRHI